MAAPVQCIRRRPCYSMKKEGMMKEDVKKEYMKKEPVIEELMEKEEMKK